MIVINPGGCCCSVVCEACDNNGPANGFHVVVSPPSGTSTCCDYYDGEFDLTEYSNDAAYPEVWCFWQFITDSCGEESFNLEYTLEVKYNSLTDTTTLTFTVFDPNVSISVLWSKNISGKVDCFNLNENLPFVSGDCVSWPDVTITSN